MDSPLVATVRAYMRQHHLRQADFARLSGVDKGTLNRILVGTTSQDRVTAETLQRIAETVGKTMEECLSGRAKDAADPKLRNDLTALQISVRSIAKALYTQMPGVASAFADAIFADVGHLKEETGKVFETDSGLMLEVLQNLGRVQQAAEASSPPSELSDSVRRSKR